MANQCEEGVYSHILVVVVMQPTQGTRRQPGEREGPNSMPGSTRRRARSVAVAHLTPVKSKIAVTGEASSQVNVKQRQPLTAPVRRGV